MISKTVVVTILFYLVTILAEPDGTIVQLEKGKIRGTIRKSENGNDYYAFQEIPFAAPPVGSKRFQLPQEPEPWEGILNTTRNTKICKNSVFRPKYMESTEDCLYINVYTPVVPGSNKKLLPVLLWIHGGAFIFGAGTYDSFGPKYIIDHGVVVVTLNYRLGVFGFLGTDDGTIPLNLGLKDQRLAIEWVNKNIGKFGGDPNHVVLAGESAGSMSVSYHIISQKPNENLFQAAMMQSGSAIDSGLKQSDPDNAAFQLGKLLDKNFSSNSTLELLKVLQNADADDILEAGISGAVTVEKDGLVSVPAYQAYIDKEYKKIPVLLGINSEEGLSFSLPKNETKLKQVDADPTQLISVRVNIPPKFQQTVGLKLKQLYVGNGSFEEDFGAFIRYTSDMVFTNGVIKQVELSCTDAPYYFYQFAYKGELGQQMGLISTIPDDVEKVAHAEELPYLWEDINCSDLSQYPKEDRLTLHRMVKMWTNFVKYFNPTPESDPLLGNITWLTAEPASLRYLNINCTLEMREHPRQYQQVKAILDKYMVPPFDSYS